MRCGVITLLNSTLLIPVSQVSQYLTNTAFECIHHHLLYYKLILVPTPTTTLPAVQEYLHSWRLQYYSVHRLLQMQFN